MERIKESYIDWLGKVVREILIKSGVEVVDNIIYAGKEKWACLHRDMRKYPVVTLLLSPYNALDFMDYLISELPVERLWMGVRSGGVPSFFDDDESVSEISVDDFIDKAKKELLDSKCSVSIGLKMKIGDNYYYMSTIGDNDALVIEQFIFCILMNL